jgi:hypothetical protein
MDVCTLTTFVKFWRVLGNAIVRWQSGEPARDNRHNAGSDFPKLEFADSGLWSANSGLPNSAALALLCWYMQNASWHAAPTNPLGQKSTNEVSKWK